MRETSGTGRKRLGTQRKEPVWCADWRPAAGSRTTAVATQMRRSAGIALPAIRGGAKVPRAKEE